MFSDSWGDSGTEAWWVGLIFVIISVLKLKYLARVRQAATLHYVSVVVTRTEAGQCLAPEHTNIDNVGQKFE